VIFAIFLARTGNFSLRFGMFHLLQYLCAMNEMGLSALFHQKYQGV